MKGKKQISIVSADDGKMFNNEIPLSHNLSCVVCNFILIRFFFSFNKNDAVKHKEQKKWRDIKQRQPKKYWKKRNIVRVNKQFSSDRLRNEASRVTKWKRTYIELSHICQQFCIANISTYEKPNPNDNRDERVRKNVKRFFSSSWK